MKDSTYKILFFVLLVVFLLENLFIAWGFSLIAEEERDLNTCYYDVCSEFPEALLEGKVCSCYDYDNLGYAFVAQTEVLE